VFGCVLGLGGGCGEFNALHYVTKPRLLVVCTGGDVCWDGYWILKGHTSTPPLGAPNYDSHSPRTVCVRLHFHTFAVKHTLRLMCLSVVTAYSSYFTSYQLSAQLARGMSR
jgi:hypothetical protein